MNISAYKLKSVPWNLLVITILMGGICLIQGDDEKRSTAEQPWKRLEQELQQKGHAVDTQSLTKLAKNSHAEVDVRWAALEILGWRSEKAALNDIREIARNETHPLIVETAGLALARLGEEEGKTILKERFEKTTSQVRKLFLASRLAEFNDPSGYSEVAKAAQASEEFVRYSAVGALVCFIPFEGKKSGETTMEPLRLLRVLAKDSYQKIREEVLIELPIGLKKGLSVADCRSIIEEMSKEDPDPELRNQAKGLLLIIK